MNNINLDALNPQGRGTGATEQSEPKNVEEYFKRELRKNVNGDPQRLRQNHTRLEEEIKRIVSDDVIISERQTGEARERQRQRAIANGEKLKEVLDSLYFQEARNTEFDTGQLPPEPRFNPPTKPMGWFGLIFRTLLVAGSLMVVGFFISTTGINNRDMVTMYLGAGLFFIGFFGFFPYMRRLAGKSEEQEKGYKQAKEDFDKQHAEWVRLKEEYELRKRVSGDNLRKFM